MVSSRLSPCIKCSNCNNVCNIVVQTPTEQLLSFMEIIPTPETPASINADSTNTLNHAILKLKKLAIEPSNDLFFKKTIICSKCAKFMATEYSYHNMDEPGMNAVISAIQEASKKTNIEILKGDNLYDNLINQIKENDPNKMLYFILPYEDIMPLLKLNETAENQKLNLIIENIVSPSEETSPFPVSNNESEQPVQQPSPTASKKLSKLNTKDLNEEESKNKKEQAAVQQHLFVSVKI